MKLSYYPRMRRDVVNPSLCVEDLDAQRLDDDIKGYMGRRGQRHFKLIP